MAFNQTFVCCFFEKCYNNKAYNIVYTAYNIIINDNMYIWLNFLNFSLPPKANS